MLTSDLLMHSYRGDELVPKSLALTPANRAIASEVIGLFAAHLSERRGLLDDALRILEGEETNYRIKRGLAHLLTNGFSTFEVISPLDPPQLRERLFTEAAKHCPSPENSERLLAQLSDTLSHELGQVVTPTQIRDGLYADLAENQIMTGFDAPTPDDLIHRYNLAQAQGILYRASQLVITAYRNVPGQYKLLFRYLKLFGLMAYIEGDADHGFTITIDGPASLFRQTSSYGVNLAKFLPALLNVSNWQLDAELIPRQRYDGQPSAARYSLSSADTTLKSHYKPGKAFDSILEEALSKRWETATTEWQLEREVDLVSIPGSVMIPDFRLVHPDGRSYLFEIVGYWRPEYLKKKFAQVRKSGRKDLILAVSERLNLANVGIDIKSVSAAVMWFKGKIEPKEVLALIEG